jgi:hypothetical protein
VVEGLKSGGKFQGWRLATVAELREFFARFTGTEDGHSSDPSIERALQRVLGGPLDQVSNAESGWHRSATAGTVGNPVGPDKNLVHYNMGYIRKDSYFGQNPAPRDVTIDPDSGRSSVPGFSSPSIGTFLVRAH